MADVKYLENNEQKNIFITIDKLFMSSYLNNDYLLKLLVNTDTFYNLDNQKKNNIKEILTNYNDIVLKIKNTKLHKMYNFLRHKEFYVPKEIYTDLEYKTFSIKKQKIIKKIKDDTLLLDDLKLIKEYVFLINSLKIELNKLLLIVKPFVKIKNEIKINCNVNQNTSEYNYYIKNVLNNKFIKKYHYQEDDLTDDFDTYKKQLNDDELIKLIYVSLSKGNLMKYNPIDENQIVEAKKLDFNMETFESLTEKKMLILYDSSVSPYYFFQSINGYAGSFNIKSVNDINKASIINDSQLKDILDHIKYYNEDDSINKKYFLVDVSLKFKNYSAENIIKSHSIASVIEKHLLEKDLNITKNENITENNSDTKKRSFKL